MNLLQLTRHDPLPGDLAQLNECYNALCDDLSKELFFARLAVDLDPSTGHVAQLAKISGFSASHILSSLTWLPELVNNQTPVYLYGTSVLGTAWFQLLSKPNLNIRGFFSRSYRTLSTYCGLPVLEPPLNANAQSAIEPDAVIIITASTSDQEIFQLLSDANFPCNRIYHNLSGYVLTPHNQYFDFMDFMPKNGAFVDGGCYDMDTSIQFARRCNHEYSKIFAFEPDEKNYAVCQHQIDTLGMEHVELIRAGLWSEQTTLRFHATQNSSSFFDPTGDLMLPVVTLDEIVKDERVSMIKMDIEGSELKALHGAAHTIRRDKPLCAICIYHKPGDMLSIAHYLKQLVPEYRFAIRHYSIMNTETVLYAFV